MGCYVIPTAAAVLQHITKKKNPGLRNKYQKWLSHLLIGGSVFGLVDHIFNKELFAFSVFDMALGLVITLSLIVIWQVLVLVDQSKQKVTFKA